ncbi:hypothetical protein Scep_015101 [Stephania cephalantha]|uniref:Uncharacterized protein n=1 Tax=Stephania cephalantha TaxID=152367 RepID=A0AAP0J401_9MAGN
MVQSLLTLVQPWLWGASLLVVPFAVGNSSIRNFKSVDTMELPRLSHNKTCNVVEVMILIAKRHSVPCSPTQLRIRSHQNPFQSQARYQARAEPAVKRGEEEGMWEILLQGLFPYFPCIRAVPEGHGQLFRLPHRKGYTLHLGSYVFSSLFRL